MKIIVIDTAQGACTAGVFEGDTPRGLRSEVMARGHQERLGGLVRDAMGDSGLAFADLDRIGVTVGPGSFTGLRVGLAFALGLGAALNRPVVGLSSLDALAAASPSGLTAAAIDARRGQVYLRLFLNGEALGPPQALDLEAAATSIAGAAASHAEATLTLVGSGAPLLSSGFPGAAVSVLEAPRPEHLARLAQTLEPASAPARPLYLRAPDATPPTRVPGAPRVAPGVSDSP